MYSARDAQTALYWAKAAYLAGGVSILADACGVSPQAVYKWLRAGNPPSLSRCMQVEQAVAGQITWSDLLTGAFAATPHKPKGQAKKQPSV